MSNFLRSNFKIAEAKLATKFEMLIPIVIKVFVNFS